MRRIVILSPLLVVALACKKAPKAEPEEPAHPPKVGHSITKVNEDGTPVAGGSGSGSGSAASGSAEGSAAPPVSTRVAHHTGGDGKPAYRDENDHPHGPGGQVFLGKAECDDAHDHCLRPGVWFAVGNFTPSRLYRAIPIYELDGKWYNWRGDPEPVTKAYRTALAGKTPIPAGTPIIWYSVESGSKWPESEFEALTSSRWEAALTRQASANGTVQVKNFGDVPLDTVRVVVEAK